MSPTITLYVKDSDDAIWASVRQYAEKTGTSLSVVVTDALRAYLAGPTSEKPDILVLLKAAVKAEQRRRSEERTHVRERVKLLRGARKRTAKMA